MTRTLSEAFPFLISSFSFLSNFGFCPKTDPANRAKKLNTKSVRFIVSLFQVSAFRGFKCLIGGVQGIFREKMAGPLFTLLNPLNPQRDMPIRRSEERRVGKECRS